MQAQAFDRIAREVGDGATRRGFFRVLGAAAALGGGLLLAATSADAKNQGKRHGKAQRHHHGKGRPRGKAPHPQHGDAVQAASCSGVNQPCTKKRPGIGKRRTCCGRLVCRNRRCRPAPECPSFSRCGGACVDLQTDPHNCGRCGNDCGSDRCLGGTCAGRCVAGLTLCDGACVDILRDPQHCGGCQTTCGERSPICQDGRCTPLEVGEACRSTHESVYCRGAERGGATCAAVDARKLNRSDCDVAETGLQCCLFDGQACQGDCDCCGSSYCSSETGVCTDASDPPPARCLDLGGQCPGYGSDRCCGYPDVLCCAFGSCSKPFQGVGFCRRDCRQLGEACTDDPLGGTANHCCSNLYCVNRVCRTQPCVPYGGSCQSAGDCCDGVPCSGGLCRYN